VDRHDEGIHPVIVAVLAAVLDQALPRIAGLDRAPEILEGLRRHVGVADDVVVLAFQLFPGKAGELDEDIVGVNERALEIGLRNQVLAFGVRLFDIGDGQVFLHSICLRTQRASGGIDAVD